MQTATPSHLALEEAHKAAQQGRPDIAANVAPTCDAYADLEFRLDIDALFESDFVSNEEPTSIRSNIVPFVPPYQR